MLRLDAGKDLLSVMRVQNFQNIQKGQQQAAAQHPSKLSRREKHQLSFDQFCNIEKFIRTMHRKHHLCLTAAEHVAVPRRPSVVEVEVDNCIILDHRVVVVVEVVVKSLLHAAGLQCVCCSMKFWNCI